MSDLISRKAAIEEVGKESQLDGSYGYMDTKSIVDLLNDLPSAQPEIIRCKDCIYWSDNLYCADFYTMEPEGFCSWAKKRK